MMKGALRQEEEVFLPPFLLRKKAVKEKVRKNVIFLDTRKSTADPSKAKKIVVDTYQKTPDFSGCLLDSLLQPVRRFSLPFDQLTGTVNEQVPSSGPDNCIEVGVTPTGLNLQPSTKGKVNLRQATPYQRRRHRHADQLMEQEEETEEKEEEPVTIQLTGNRDVSIRAKKLAKTVQEATDGVDPIYIDPLPNLEGLVSQDEFNQALQIYETNQFYLYQKYQAIDNSDGADLIRDLTALERWFFRIIEPKPRLSRKKKDQETNRAELEEWQQREEGKEDSGFSPFCPSEVRQVISSVSPTDVSWVKKLQKKIFL